jgi:hypothetical protein
MPHTLERKEASIPELANTMNENTQKASPHVTIRIPPGAAWQAFDFPAEIDVNVREWTAIDFAINGRRTMQPTVGRQEGETHEPNTPA